MCLYLYDGRGAGRWEAWRARGFATIEWPFGLERIELDVNTRALLIDQSLYSWMPRLSATAAEAWGWHVTKMILGNNKHVRPDSDRLLLAVRKTRNHGLG